MKKRELRALLDEVHGNLRLVLIPHEEYTSCWCRPRVGYVDRIGQVVTHRDVRYEDVETKFRIVYNDDGEPGWPNTDVVPYIHVLP